jgi:DNA-binding IclR family transcriptional regulator
VLAAIEGRRRTADEVAEAAGIGAEEARGLLGQLVEEGDVLAEPGGRYTAAAR